jgi:predicted MFS family arabinose efflux permease
LSGGLVTLVTARVIGVLTDRKGKVFMFRLMAVLVIFPMVATTLTEGLPMWAVLSVSTVFFASMSGRMIPGMAIITSAANPQFRGTFMALNSAVQSAAMGIAAFVGGLIVSRDAQNLVQHYWMAAVVGASASVAAIFVVGKLKLYQSSTQTAK